MVLTNDLTTFLFLVIAGLLAGIIYSMRILIILERRIANMEQSIQRVELKILAKLSRKKPKKR